MNEGAIEFKRKSQVGFESFTTTQKLIETARRFEERWEKEAATLSAVIKLIWETASGLIQLENRIQSSYQKCSR